MERKEEIFLLLEEFEKHKSKDIPRLLDDYIGFVAKTGDPLFLWPKVKFLFQQKLQQVLSDYYETCPSQELLQSPNLDQFNFDVMRNKILEKLESFGSAPFTIQRLCELLTSPRKEYNRTDKFMRAIEKNILVVTTREPGHYSPAMNGVDGDEVVRGGGRPDAPESRDGAHGSGTTAAVAAGALRSPDMVSGLSPRGRAAGSDTPRSSNAMTSSMTSDATSGTKSLETLNGMDDDDEEEEEEEEEEEGSEEDDEEEASATAAAVTERGMQRSTTEAPASGTTVNVVQSSSRAGERPVQPTATEASKPAEPEKNLRVEVNGICKPENTIKQETNAETTKKKDENLTETKSVSNVKQVDSVACKISETSTLLRKNSEENAASTSSSKDSSSKQENYPETAQSGSTEEDKSSSCDLAKEDEVVKMSVESSVESDSATTAGNNIPSATPIFSTSISKEDSPDETTTVPTSKVVSADTPTKAKPVSTTSSSTAHNPAEESEQQQDYIPLAKNTTKNPADASLQVPPAKRLCSRSAASAASAEDIKVESPVQQDPSGTSTTSTLAPTSGTSHATAAPKSPDTVVVAPAAVSGPEAKRLEEDAESTNSVKSDGAVKDSST